MSPRGREGGREGGRSARTVVRATLCDKRAPLQCTLVVALILDRGVRPKGGVYGIYLPTPFAFRRHGAITAVRRLNGVKPLSTLGTPHEEVAFRGVMRLALSHGLACSARTRFPLLRSGRLLRRLTRRLYDVALTRSVLCTRELVREYVTRWRRREGHSLCV